MTRSIARRTAALLIALMAAGCAGDYEGAPGAGSGGPAPGGGQQAKQSPQTKRHNPRRQSDTIPTDDVLSIFFWGWDC